MNPSIAGVDPKRPTDNNNYSLGVALAAIPWLAAVAAFGPSGRSWVASLTIAVGAALVQFGVSKWATGSWVARIRTNQASQIWFGGMAAAAAALLLGRLVPIQTSWLEIGVGALVATLAFAFVEEYQHAAALDAGHSVRRAAVIGTGEEAGEWVRLFKDHPEIGIELVGCIGDAAQAQRVGLSDVHLGSTAEMLQICEAHQVDMPIVAVASFRRPAVQAIVDELLEAGFDVAVTWGVGRLSSARLTSAVVGHETLPLIRAKRPQIGAKRFKRAFDCLVASVMLTLASPIIAMAAIAVRLESDGPAFFKQERVGLGGKTFQIIKLRSMATTAEEDIKELSDFNLRSGPLFKMKSDPRVTKVGKILRASSLDELPQLWNVIRGDMSLVGPRPALPSETEQFDQDLKNRSLVRPGLTGLWQVEARANEAFGAYRRLDLHYLENWSLLLDFRIMFATAQMLTIGTAVGPFVKKFGQPEVEVVAPSKLEVAPQPAEKPVMATADRDEALMLGA